MPARKRPWGLPRLGWTQDRTGIRLRFGTGLISTSRGASRGRCLLLLLVLVLLNLTLTLTLTMLHSLARPARLLVAHRLEQGPGQVLVELQAPRLRRIPAHGAVLPDGLRGEPQPDAVVVLDLVDERDHAAHPHHAHLLRLQGRVRTDPEAGTVAGLEAAQLAWGLRPPLGAAPLGGRRQDALLDVHAVDLLQRYAVDGHRQAVGAHRAGRPLDTEGAVLHVLGIEQLRDARLHGAGVAQLLERVVGEGLHEGDGLEDHLLLAGGLVVEPRRWPQATEAPGVRRGASHPQVGSGRRYARHSGCGRGSSSSSSASRSIRARWNRLDLHLQLGHQHRIAVLIADGHRHLGGPAIAQGLRDRVQLTSGGKIRY